MTSTQSGKDVPAKTEHASHLGGPSSGELASLLDEAFDYRGDVTLHLANGTTLTGYLFSHDPHSPEPCVKVYPTHSSDRVTLRTADILGVELSGDDKAAGRSWQAWVQRYDEKKRLRAQGHDVGNIEPQPDSLD